MTDQIGKQKSAPLTWNPSQPMPKYETWHDWMRMRRDVGAKASDVKNGETVVAVQEANMAGVYWRLLWPKDRNNLNGVWWQDTESSCLTASGGSTRSNEANNKMSKLRDGDTVTIQDVVFVAKRRPADKFAIDLIRCDAATPSASSTAPSDQK